jgi:hemerythrin-like domain-containing protein
MEMPHCSMVHGQSNIELCAGLQQLKDEHVALSEQKLDLNEAAGRIKNGEAENLKEALIQLRKDTENFSSHLKNHATREENVLFVKMAQYIGRETGPIAVMEYEHDEAEKYIDIFLNGTKTIDTDQAGVLATYVQQMYELLTSHFFKEENVLFPMAEHLFSNEEKETLAAELC